MRRLLTVLAIAVASGGCSSVSGSAIRTGPVKLGAYAGPVAIYATGRPPAGAVDLGVVEVHAAQQEATVDTLLPLFLQKVASIGGNVAVIEGTRARFELAGRTQVEQFYYSCAVGRTCSGTRVYSTNDELMVLSMFGRAMSTQITKPDDAPLLPETPAVAPPEPSPPAPSAPAPSAPVPSAPVPSAPPPPAPAPPPSAPAPTSTPGESTL